MSGLKHGGEKRSARGCGWWSRPPFTKIFRLGVEGNGCVVIADFVETPRKTDVGDRLPGEPGSSPGSTTRFLKFFDRRLFGRGKRWMTFVLESGKARLRSWKSAFQWN